MVFILLSLLYGVFASGAAAATWVQTTSDDFKIGTTLSTLEVTGYGTPAILKILQQYTDANTWEGKADTNPYSLMAFGGMVWDNADYIYVLAAVESAPNFAKFDRYSISRNVWEGLPNPPSVPAEGCSMVWNGGDLLYALRGSTSTEYWRYHIPSGTWETMAPTPGTCAAGASMAYPGGDFIYALRGNNTMDFWRYYISSNTWEAMASVLGNVYGQQPLLAYPGSGNYLYALKANYSTDFYRYDIAGDMWTTRTGPPKPTLRSLIWAGGDKLFTLGANDWTGVVSYMYTYSINGDNWTVKAAPPANLGQYQATLCWTGGDTLFALRGYTSGVNPPRERYDQEFWDYSISQDKWNAMAYLPYYRSASSSPLANVGGDYIYSFVKDKDNNLEFWRYNSALSTWEARTGPPFGISYFQYGTCMVYPGTGDNIYACAGAASTYFAAHSISNNTWSQKSYTPAMGCGAVMVYGGDKYLYAFTGNGTGNYFDPGTNKFYRYDMNFDLWSDAPADAPSGVEPGSSLTWDGGNYIYALKGGTLTPTKVFWRYNISGNTWEVMASTPQTVQAGASLAYPGFGDYIYSTRGGGRDYMDFWRYKISGNTWEARASSPYSYNGQSFMVPAGNKLYTMMGDYNFRPYNFALWTGYSNSGVFTSAAKDTGNYAAFTTISWNPASQPGGATVKFQLATNKNNSTWNFKGPGGSTEAYYTTPGQAIWSGHTNDRYIKFKAFFDTTNSSVTPTLDDVTLTYGFGPIAPASIIGTAESTTTIRWSWSNVADENGYYLHDGAHAVKGSTGVDVTSTLESNLSANTQYARHVNAYNTFGSSESGSYSRYTWANIPTSLTTAEVTSSTIRIAWSGNGTRYAVERATQEAGPWTYLATWENNVSTAVYTDSGLLPLTTYWYRTRAYNGDQVITNPSSVLSVKTISAASPYTTKVGSNEGWSWRSVQPGEKMQSGTPLDWQWRIWKSEPGMKVPSGEAHDWIWGDE